MRKFFARIFGSKRQPVEQTFYSPALEPTHGWSPGDRVLTPKGNIGSIRAIVEDEAWVKTGKGQNVVVHVTLLDSPPY